jgi:L-alanine-DL-glutamate epimerase-like enolase superfamily enzyme
LRIASITPIAVSLPPAGPGLGVEIDEAAIRRFAL